ncbi:hypothetical protein [Mesorhizobium sp. M0715]|uniref:hypothetical protein n=1 Tax=Mesorhizobium sp. M0715 TaxID=2956990 RepID=UPI00333C844E
MARLALEHGVNANLLRNWIALRRREARKELPVMKAKEPTAFIPVIEAASGSAPCAGAGALSIKREACVKPVQETTRSPQARVSAALPNGSHLAWIAATRRCWR